MKQAFIFFESHLSLSQRAIDSIEQTMDLVRFAKGSIILNLGENNNYIYIIKKGVVRGIVYENEKEITNSIWMEGDTFGDVITYISNKPATKTYEAIEDLEAYRINISKFRNLFNESHEIANLGRLIIERYVEKASQTKDLLRSKSAKEKYEFYILNRPGLINRIKLKYSASYLDITPETLSRLRNTSI